MESFRPKHLDFFLGQCRLASVIVLRLPLSPAGRFLLFSSYTSFARS